MFYQLAADFLVLLHLSFIIFVFFGGFFALKWRFFIWLHLPAAIWGVIVEWMGWICPLTPLEWELREKGGQSGYSGGFVEHYIIPLIYPAGLTREFQIIIGSIVILVNLFVYGFLLYKYKQHKSFSNIKS